MLAKDGKNRKRIKKVSILGGGVSDGGKPPSNPPKKKEQQSVLSSNFRSRKNLQQGKGGKDPQ